MASDDIPAGWVRLNVGGTIFVTTKQTLRSSPYFAWLLATDARMPDATADTHFVDRNPDRFTEVLDYLRDGTLLADKNCNLEELRREAQFYGLYNLVKAIDETKAHDEYLVSGIVDNLVRIFNETLAGSKLPKTTKSVVVSIKDGSKSIEIAVSPPEDDHFLLDHVKERYPCLVRAPKFQFPDGFTFELQFCRACKQCAGSARNKYDCRSRYHSCFCAPSAEDAMLKDVAARLKAAGFVVDQSVGKAVSDGGRSATSWTFVKREG